MDDARDPDRADSVLAAELVLGLLEGEDRAAALRRQLADPAFAAEVEFWRSRVQPLYDGFAAVEPPEHLWDAIEREVGPITARRPDASGYPEVQQDTNLLVFPDRSFRWKIATLVSSAVAAVLALALLLPRGLPSAPVAPIPDAGMAVAQLSGPIDGLLLTARYDRGAARLWVRVEGMPETETEPEIWVVDADGRPRSLGQLGRRGVTVLEVPDSHRPLLDDQRELILTMEPDSAEPHDAPTAPAVARGTLQRV